ncbi:DNA helicase [Tanacetum coccineum]|uniref:DNA helicase n=1 Tax=Tanacetum coccineum TaxID=301880 RepID=A0ABQ4Z6A2_9ASTR
MRLVKPGMNEEEQKNSEEFATWILDVGNREVGEHGEEDAKSTAWINIPPRYYVTTYEKRITELIDFIYDEETLRRPTAASLQEKAIVCPKNDTADVINKKILSMIKGETITYLRNDEAIPVGGDIAHRSLNHHTNKSWFSTKMSETTIVALRPGQRNCTLEAKVYRRWISKSVQDLREIGFATS